MAIENRKKILDKKMPNNMEAEQSVLGCILINNEIAMEVISQLQEKDFYSDKNKIVFLAIKDLAFARKPIDEITLIENLKNKGELESIGGAIYIAELINKVPSSIRYNYYVDIIKTCSIKRKLIQSSQEIIEKSHSEVDRENAIAYAEKLIFDISNDVQTSTLVNLKETYAEVMQKFEDLAKGSDKYKGVSTGFTDLDKILNGGLHKSDLVLVAARPGMGKTSFSLNVVQHIGLDQGKVCAIFSLEMPKIQLAQKVICGRACVSMEDALNGRLSQSQWEKLFCEQGKFEQSKVFVDDSSLITPAEILSKCRNLKIKEERLDVVMIDYIQLMSGGGSRYDNRQQEVSEISRNLKILAKELDVPVIALSQLSRETAKRAGQKPQLSDLRESGAIEQDADIVMFIHRPDKAGDPNAIPNVVELIIEKHRNGRQGTVNLRWEGSTTSFRNMEDSVIKPKEEINNAEDIKEEEIKVGDLNKVFNQDQPSEEIEEIIDNEVEESFE